MQTPKDLTQNPGWFALPEWKIWQAEGADQQRYLQGQLTNDVTQATARQAVRSFICNAKGQVEGELFIWKTAGDDFRFAARQDVAEDLLMRLDRYIISDDVMIQDRTEDFALFHLIGPGTGDLACHVAGELKQQAGEGQIQALLNPRYRLSGFDLLVPRDLADTARQVLREKLPEVPADLLEPLRIEQAIPDWPHELSQGVLPAETGLLQETVSFTKGCYIGQEVISRMKSSGKVRRRLCGLRPLPADAEGAPLPGWELLAPGKEDAKPVGILTSYTPRASLKTAPGLGLSLGLVKDGLHHAGTELIAKSPEENGPTTRVQVVQLPLHAPAK